MIEIFEENKFYLRETKSQQAKSNTSSNQMQSAELKMFKIPLEKCI